MKVALVILHADAARGGAERYTVDLAAALAGRGHGVSVVCSDGETSERSPPVRQIGLQAKGLTRTSRYKRFLRLVEQHTRTERYDIVHAMLPVRRCDLYHPHAGVAVAALDKWNIWFNPRRRAMARVERHLLTPADGPIVLCLSDYVKRFVRQHYPLPDERLARLFNAVDLNRFTPPMQRPSTGWVNALMIAQDYERKGLREAIAALAKVPDPRLRLLVVGKEDPKAYASLARQLGISDRVVFHPPTSSPQEFYREADFFVLPTKHDPCSLVVLEALAMGLPVISTVFNGACEIMANGKHGFVLGDPLNVPVLAAAMHFVCDDRLRAVMSQECLLLRPRLAYEHHLDELLRIYERVLAAKRKEQV